MFSAQGTGLNLTDKASVSKGGVIINEGLQGVLSRVPVYIGVWLVVLKKNVGIYQNC